MAIEADRSIAVIDGNSLMHRAFHSIPKNMAANDGTPTNAVFGFLAMLFSFIEAHEPDGVICAFDKGAPKFRMELLEQYKAQRPPTDPDLKAQFPVIQELLVSLQIPCVMAEGWEGDDILGTLAARGEAEGYRMYLVTGDKDAYQLASDLTNIVTTRKGVSDIEIYDPARVEERYGITPDRVTDFYGLKGDSSDNIPGVPGIGEKTATKLLQQYGTLENLLDHADEVKGKVGENLRNHADDARISKQIATISKEAPIELDLLDSKFPTYSPDDIRPAFARYQLNSPLKRAISFLDADDASALHEEASDALDLSAPITGDAAMQLLEAALDSGERIGVHLDGGVAEGALFGVAPATLCVASSEGIAAFEDDIHDLLARVLAEASVAALDLKALIQAVVPRDSAEPAHVDPMRIPMESHTDLQVVGYLLDSSRSSYDLDMLLETYASVSLPEATEEIPAGAVVAAAARMLAPKMEAKLSTEESECYRTIELPLIPVLATMERNGMLLDKEVLAQQSTVLGEKIEALTTAIHEEAGEEFKIGSPKQLSRILFEVLDYTPKKKTRTGYSTDASVLGELTEEGPLPAMIIEWRELTKLRSTYIDALPRMVAEGDGRLHTTYHQTVAATGRLSSSDPNLQNIPVRTETGRAIREAFVVPEGRTFVSADYSQIELRLLAHLSGDEGLIDAFEHGRDFHATTASAVFGVDVDEITPDLRSRAKAVNFGIVYGQQAYGLSQSLKIGFGEAQEMIDRYFAAFPAVRSYLDETVSQATEDGYAVTMFGRRRPIPELGSRNPNLRGFGERTAMNHPLQGSAADIIKLAMIRMQEKLDEEGLETLMVLQVHDELDFEVPAAEVERVKELAIEVMSGVVELKVPLSVSVSEGDTWAVAH